jgi:hypothetical protein
VQPTTVAVICSEHTAASTPKKDRKLLMLCIAGHCRLHAVPQRAADDVLNVRLLVACNAGQGRALKAKKMSVAVKLKFGACQVLGDVKQQPQPGNNVSSTPEESCVPRMAWHSCDAVVYVFETYQGQLATMRNIPPVAGR